MLTPEQITTLLRARMVFDPEVDLLTGLADRLDHLGFRKVSYGEDLNGANITTNWDGSMDRVSSIIGLEYGGWHCGGARPSHFAGHRLTRASELTDENLPSLIEELRRWDYQIVAHSYGTSTRPIQPEELESEEVSTGAVTYSVDINPTFGAGYVSGSTDSYRIYTGGDVQLNHIVLTQLYRIGILTGGAPGRSAARCQQAHWIYINGATHGSNLSWDRGRRRGRDPRRVRENRDLEIEVGDLFHSRFLALPRLDEEAYSVTIGGSVIAMSHEVLKATNQAIKQVLPR